MSTETVLSVRGDAQRTVAPDYATLDATLVVPPAARPDALKTLRRNQDQLTASLSELGGVALTVDTQRATLTWSLGSVSVHDEYHYDESSEENRATGNVSARASVVIAARDLRQLAQLSETLAKIEHLNVAGVQWQVDTDNAAWRLVRAAAIHAALAKAADYATALGGTVLKVDHVADAGLLESGFHQHRGILESHAATASVGSVGGDSVPTLDPVPQEIRAVIEARVTAQTDPPSLQP